MKQRIIMSWVCLSVSALTALGCGGSDARVEDTGFDVAPQNLQQASASIRDVLGALKRDPLNRFALNAEAQLLPQLDALNHLVARVEVSPNHQVKFYEPAPGQILITEHRSKEDAPVLGEADHEVPPVALFKRLAKLDTAPIELVNAQERAQEANAAAAPDPTTSVRSLQPSVGAGASAATASESLPAAAPSSEEVASQSSALTAADGNVWRTTHCFKNWPHLLCLPNWGNGGFWDFNTRQSGFKIAPFSGDRVVVTAFYEGGIFFVDTALVGEIDEWNMASAQNDCAGFWPFRVCQAAVRHHRWEIREATGDQFHWSAYAY